MLIVCFFSSSNSTELRWNWNSFSLTDIFFPSSFFWGVSDSALQVEGNESTKGPIDNDNWLVFERNYPIAPEERVGRACQRWSRYEEDIERIASLGMNMYRFSISWSKIEPQEGVFDYHALDHYQKIIDLLLSKNITPMITLFHHSYPAWFDTKGGFEVFSNLYYFFRFADLVFKRFHTKVPYWITYNEPVAYALEAFFRGVYPPCKHSFLVAGKVARNLLFSHVEIARHFKKINPKVQVGIAHIVNPLDAYSSWNPFEQLAAKFFNGIVNDLTINFFKTGKFNWGLLVRDFLAEVPQSLDFIGINYYTHTVLRQIGWFGMATVARPEEKKLTERVGPADDKNSFPSKTMYPEGLYRAVQLAAALKIPIFITENGCSATCGQNLQEEYIQKHLYVISQLLKEGHPIKGYLYWSLTDCFCWRRGYRNKNGIFALDFQTQERTFRPAFAYLVNTIAHSRNGNTIY